jgi:hypothetical protein
MNVVVTATQSQDFFVLFFGLDCAFGSIDSIKYACRVIIIMVTAVLSCFHAHASKESKEKEMDGTDVYLFECWCRKRRPSFQRSS